MSQARIATARTTYTLDIDPYDGHVVLFDTVAYTGTMPGGRGWTTSVVLMDTETGETI